MKIPNYKIKKLIGEGGMATVYLAEDEKFKSLVAVKVLKKELVHNENIRKRFLAEARNLFKMNHTNIIKVTDLVDDGDLVAFVMEYIEGQTLKDYFDTIGKLSDEEIKKLFVQMLDAVGYVHEQGLVHRDIKPSNFLISDKGNVKLLDFGIAKNTNITSSEYTMTGSTQNMGTPMYMSPEQIKSTREVTHQTDIYSLGVVLWQMVTGCKPYDSNTLSSFELQLKIVSDPLPSRQTTWDGLILSCTEKEIQRRIVAVDNILSILKNDIVENVTEIRESNFENTVIENKRIYPIDMEWSRIPDGSSTMGSPIYEVGRFDNEIQHQVSLSGFMMSKYTITFKQYDIFCEATGRNKPNDEGWGRGKRPVINVSWDDATAFAAWMGCRLPTEAEWEYACRAGITTPFNIGYDITTKQSNFNGRHSFSFFDVNTYKYAAKTLTVGCFIPNAWGLFDMHGNVCDWCSNWYGKYSTQPQADPNGPSIGTYRVIRGGSWHSNVRGCRSAFRGNSTPNHFDSNIGFRIVSHN